MTNFEHTAKGRAALAQTEADNEGMFQAARKDNQVLRELLTQIDFADELEYLLHLRGLDNQDELSARIALKNVTEEMLINDCTLAEAIAYLIADEEQYARRFYDELIEEYEGFHK